MSRIRERRQARRGEWQRRVVALCTVLLLSSLVWMRQHRTFKTLPSPETAAHVRPAVHSAVPRPSYPYSVIPGGIRTPAELRDAIRTDPTVAHHYRGFRLERAHFVQADRPRMMHVSYRRGDTVYWTRRPVSVPRGELLVTDGENWARARCGNRLAEIPSTFTADPQEPSARELDTPAAARTVPLMAGPVPANDANTLLSLWEPQAKAFNTDVPGPRVTGSQKGSAGAVAGGLPPMPWMGPSAARSTGTPAVTAAAFAPMLPGTPVPPLGSFFLVLGSITPTAGQTQTFLPAAIPTAGNSTPILPGAVISSLLPSSFIVPRLIGTSPDPSRVSVPANATTLFPPTSETGTLVSTPPPGEVPMPELPVLPKFAPPQDLPPGTDVMPTPEPASILLMSSALLIGGISLVFRRKASL